jgi:hypothetical protein
MLLVRLFTLLLATLSGATAAASSVGLGNLTAAIYADGKAKASSLRVMRYESHPA